MFFETFDQDSIGTKLIFKFFLSFEVTNIKKKTKNRWLKSNAKKDGVEDTIAKYDGQWSVESSTDSVLDGDKGLVLKSKAKHHAISSKLLNTFQFTDGKSLVVQYEVKFQTPLECGGAYVKLLSDDASLNLVNNRKNFQKLLIIIKFLI